MQRARSFRDLARAAGMPLRGLPPSAPETRLSRQVQRTPQRGRPWRCPRAPDQVRGRLWRVLYPLHEVLLLVTCATLASCDDFDDIVAWGKDHLAVLRRFSPFHHGIPGERWLRALVNRVDPLLFARCFESWIAALWPGRHDLIAIDGKTARRTHDRRRGLKALHTLSAYATNARLTLAQLSVPEKTNEITASRTC